MIIKPHKTGGNLVYGIGRRIFLEQSSTGVLHDHAGFRTDS